VTEPAPAEQGCVGAVELPTIQNWRSLVEAACGLFDLDKGLTTRKRQALRRSCYDGPDPEHLIEGVTASLRRVAPGLSEAARHTAQQALDLLEAGRPSSSLSRMTVLEIAVALHELRNSVARAESRKAGKQSRRSKPSPDIKARADWLRAEIRKLPDWMSTEPRAARARWLHGKAAETRWIWSTPRALEEFARRRGIAI